MFARQNCFQFAVVVRHFAVLRFLPWKAGLWPALCIAYCCHQRLFVTPQERDCWFVVQEVAPLHLTIPSRFRCSFAPVMPMTLRGIHIRLPSLRRAACLTILNSFLIPPFAKIVAAVPDFHCLGHLLFY